LATDNLKPWSYVVLALVGEGGAGAHDLVDMMRRGGRLFYAAAPSQIYSETKRLAGLGLLSARKEPGRTRERTVYQLTEAGREALVEWLAQPAPWPRIQSEATLRLLAGDMLEDETIVASLSHLRKEIAELCEAMDEAERRAAKLPHRERYLRLEYSLGRRILRAHLEWLEEVEETLLSDRGASDDGASRDASGSPAGLPPAEDG
jgi:PadR family transcriptional regulator, regulatory protein AphA